MNNIESFEGYYTKITNHIPKSDKVNENNDARTSYWDGNGKYQKEYDRLWKELVPGSGEAETEEGELIRAVGRLFYEYCNNGNCNAAENERDSCYACGGSGEVENPNYDPDDEDGYEDEYEYCYDCDGTGWEDGELIMDDFYENFLDLIEDKVGCTKEVQAVRDLILNPSLNYNYTYSQEEMDKYNKLTDCVVEYVLEKEKENK
jgi:hypothetical protein